jgi:hypothetical protein
MTVLADDIISRTMRSTELTGLTKRKTHQRKFFVPADITTIVIGICLRSLRRIINPAI